MLEKERNKKALEEYTAKKIAKKEKAAAIKLATKQKFKEKKKMKSAKDPIDPDEHELDDD